MTLMQSRIGASLLASILLLLVHLSFNKPTFAYAVKVDSRIPPDHNHPLFDLDVGQDSLTRLQHEGFEYLVTRAQDGVSALANNAPQNMNIEMGTVQNWVFPQDEIDGPQGEVGTGMPGAQLTERDIDHISELRKRQNERQVYITINTCLQPSSSDAGPDDDDAVPPQLNLYVSQSSSNQKPGPGADSRNQQIVPLEGGYAKAVLGSGNEVYIGVSAPNASTFTGVWNYEIAASIDAPYHGANLTFPNLYFVDGDNHAALLITNDLTQALPNETVYQEWMNLSPPFGVFAHNHNDRSILALRNSYCGLTNNAKILANLPNVDNQNVAKMTNRGLRGKPKEQFYLTALNQSSQYWGVLAMNGNSTASGSGVVGGGGMVWAAINFTTTMEDNCALMYNLSFCSEVAYAVPTNPKRFSPSTGLPGLAALYDSYAAQMYQYFNFSLQQIPCKTTSSAQYSLARTCDDCARAYKQWLCAVSIPRCADYSSLDPWLKERNLGQPFANGTTISKLDSTLDQALLNAVASNSSRSSLIDDKIQPGPYKEVLPCEDLCYDLVQSCPAALGFSCPLEKRGLEDSYGKRSNDSGKITCSYLGAAYYLSGSERLGVFGFYGLFSVVLVVMTFISL